MPTILEVLEPPPAACESAAAHAARRCLPRIVTANAASYPPPSLNNFRTAAARAPADSAPALWYWQLTGEEWQRDGHSYELAKKAWRRMPAEHKAAERERDRSGRKRPADDGAKAAQRSRVKREAETLEATAAYRVVDTHAFISADGHVHLLVAPSEVRASRLEPETPCVPYLYSISVRSLATAARQATCRDLECCPHHSRSKYFKLKREVARAAGRMQKDHLPRPGRRRYVQRSSSDEGVRACRGWLDNDQQRGVFKWFKRMRRASRRLPVWKERLRAELRAIQAENAKAGRTAWCALEADLEEQLKELADPPTDSDDHDE